MALTLRIENYTASTTYDIAAVARAKSHQINRVGNKVIETWTLSIGGTEAERRTSVNNLIDLLEQAVEWHSETTQVDSVWLREATDGETAKRALIYNYELLPIDSRLADGSYLFRKASEWRLAITRSAEWEPVSVASGMNASNVNGLGGLVTLSAQAGATRDGRIYQAGFGITPTGTSQGDEIDRIWFGIRPVNQGTTTFDAVWECEDYTVGSIDTDVFTHAGSSDGDVARSQFSTGGGSDGMTRRFYCIFTDRSGTLDADDFVGSYMVLLRYQITVSGTEINVKLGSGVNPRDPVTLNEIQYLSYTDGNYRYVPLGEVHIGDRRYGPPDAVLDYFTLSLYAERLAGTGVLYSDCFVFIPKPHYIYLEDAGVHTDPNSVLVYTLENDSQVAYTVVTSTGVTVSEPNLSPDGFTYPREGGVGVLAIERTAQQVLTDQSDVSVSVFKRWRAYHG